MEIAERWVLQGVEGQVLAVVREVMPILSHALDISASIGPVLDHFDPKGRHEELYNVKENPRPVCRDCNYFDVPGNARCAVRLGLAGPNCSDSRDGFRICLGPPRGH